MKKNEIDYITTNTPGIIENCNVISRLLHPSDHRLVRVTLNIESRKQTRAFHVSKAQKYMDETKYIQELTKSDFKNIGKKPIQESYDSLEKDILKSYSTANISIKLVKNQEIITEEVIALKEEKHKLKNKQNKTNEEKTQLSKLYKTIHKQIKINTKQYKTNIMERYLDKSGAVKKAYKHLNKSKPMMSQLQDKAGALITNRKEILHIATDYYKDLYKDRISKPVQCNNHFIDKIDEEPSPAFLENEVYHSIKKLKVEKSPGPDGITNEMLVNSKEMLVAPLTRLFNQIQTEKQIPKQWTNSRIVLLY